MKKRSLSIISLLLLLCITLGSFVACGGKDGGANTPSEPEHVHVVVPLKKNMEQITEIIRREIEYRGVSVIIPRRECIQTLNRKLRQKRAQE